jgi:hypothetical protein
VEQVWREPQSNQRGIETTALRLAAAPEGRQVVVQGRLRQRRPNGRTLWEIVVEDPGGLAVIGEGER